MQLKVSAKPELELYADDFTADQGSLFDEDIEQIQVCDVKQAAMETEFETFSELMAEKESLLDEDIDKLDVCSKRQSLESEFEAYAGILEERKSYDSEEMVRQKVSAKTLEIASHFEPFNELMEGEEKLLRESLEQQDLNGETELQSMIDNPSSLKFVSSGGHQDEKPATEPEILIPQDSQSADVKSETQPADEDSQTAPLVAASQEVELPTQAESDGGTSSVLSETVEAVPMKLDPVSEHGVARDSIVEDISHQHEAFVIEAKIEESLVLSEGSEQNLLSLDIVEEESLVLLEDSELNLLSLDSLEEDLDSIAAGATETISMEVGDKQLILTNGDSMHIDGHGHDEES